MIPALLFLAETATDQSTMWLVVLSLGNLLSIGVSSILFIRMASGKAGERQVEPTQIAAIREELGALTAGVQEISGDLRSLSATVEEQTVQGRDVLRRLNAISVESGSIRDRFNDHLQDHREGKRHA